MTSLTRHMDTGIALAVTGAAFCAPFTPTRVLTPGLSGRAR